MPIPLTVLPHPHHVTFESFGVGIALSTNDVRILDRLPSLQPAQSQPLEMQLSEHRVSITTKDGLRFEALYEVHGEAAKEEVESEDLWIAGDADLELTLAFVEAHVHDCVALNAPDHLFVRGGAVLHRGRAIVLPAEGLTGRTTLVDALVRAGATAYSDAFAVFDRDGRLHSYTRHVQTPQDVATNGSGRQAHTPHVEPREATAIVFTNYTPGAEWRPEPMERGESMLALLAHAVPAEERPKETMSALSGVLDGDPVVMRSERGEADEVAPLLLAIAELERSGAA
jgi:hypothetical protein